ncbi:Shedu immune nuclease family protein [Nonomuraea bangladeshensis]|uniref:Shedu immune nuclease family protein n=1 Tax=Nonomuraea bangladeshensis TaxID=404385 RepID=A0ABV3GYY5_9ACTN
MNSEIDEFGPENWGGELPWAEEDPNTETMYARRRRPERTYLSRTFSRPEKARFVYKVFDGPQTSAKYDGREWTIIDGEHGRAQIKLLLIEEPGSQHVKSIIIQRVPTTKRPVKTALRLDGADAERLLELIRNLDYVPVVGRTTERIDDALVRDLFADATSMLAIYKRDPERFRKLITDDETARDIIAIAHRRQQVERFRKLLHDDVYFEAERARSTDRRAESVWQRFFEENSWILGVSLAGQLLTSWSHEKLEQVVAGSSISGPGKRADALLRTAGRIKSLVFAEFKTHKTELLATDAYRSGCWAPSKELAGGVAQAQGTVHRAVRDLGDRLESLAPDGSVFPDDHSYLVRPRSFLIIGQLQQLIGQAGGDHQEKIRSFELYRRNTAEPEVLTFDELLARAEWFVNTPVP